MPAAYTEIVKGLVTDSLAKMHRTIGIINFWNNAPEVSKLKGELSDVLLFSNIDEIIDNSEQIVTEITALAKVRHRDIVT